MIRVIEDEPGVVKPVDPPADRDDHTPALNEEPPPPSYDSIADPPPTYDSIFGEIQQAREESSNLAEFFKKFMILLGSTAGCTICLAFFFAIPIACIIMGAKYKDDCKAQRYIPIYLIVLGAFGILRNLVGLYSQVKNRSNAEGEEESNKAKSSFEHCISCFLVIWFIAGNVWIYSAYEPVYDDVTSPNYCDKTLYLFSFWLTTASYIVIGLMCFCMCCVAFCAGLMSN